MYGMKYKVALTILLPCSVLAANPPSLQQTCLKTVRQAVAPKALLSPAHTMEEELPLPNHMLSALRFYFETHSSTRSGDDSGFESDHEITLL